MLHSVQVYAQVVVIMLVKDVLQAVRVLVKPEIVMEIVVLPAQIAAMRIIVLANAEVSVKMCVKETLRRLVAIVQAMVVLANAAILVLEAVKVHALATVAMQLVLTNAVHHALGADVLVLMGLHVPTVRTIV